MTAAAKRIIIGSFYSALILILSLLLISPAFADGRSSDKLPFRYNQATLTAIDRELAANGRNRQYRAVLRGLRWCIVFNENDSNFEYTFTNYLTMLNELTLSASPATLKRIVHPLILRELKRAAPRLTKIFTNDEAGLEDFISILPVAYRHRAPVRPLKEFAAKYFEKVTMTDRLEKFRQAAQELNYDLLTDLVIDAAFIDMAYEMGISKDFRLPSNNYRAIMAECAKIPFLRRYGDEAYHDQNYYATHVLLALNHYGRQPVKSTAISDHVFFYLAGQYQTVRNEVGDLDLLCEYLYCFRQFGMARFRFVYEGEQYILSLQNADGSWGTPDDFQGDPYDQFHPTWTAITLLAR